MPHLILQQGVLRSEKPVVQPRGETWDDASSCLPPRPRAQTGPGLSLRGRCTGRRQV